MKQTKTIKKLYSGTHKNGLSVYPFHDFFFFFAWHMHHYRSAKNLNQLKHVLLLLLLLLLLLMLFAVVGFADDDQKPFTPFAQKSFYFVKFFVSISVSVSVFFNLSQKRHIVFMFWLIFPSFCCCFSTPSV